MKIEQFLKKTIEESPELWIRTMHNSDGTRDMYSGMLPAASLSQEQLNELCACDEFSNVEEFGVWEYVNDGELESKIYHVPNYETEDFKFSGRKANLYCFMFSPIVEITPRRVFARLNIQENGTILD